jgi:ubiquinone/menaquinone biosynthesis C-methylase UbiE
MKPIVTGQQFDAVALEYDFMSGIFHAPEFILAQLPDRRQRALDLGCGSGMMVQELSQHFQEVIGIDVSSDLLTIAQAKHQTANTHYCLMDVHNLGMQAKFDYIISQNVFHHLHDVPCVLEQVIHLLQPGGRLLITDVISERETPPTIVYLVGAFQEYMPNVRKYGLKNANRIFRFRVSKHWLGHLATDKYLSACAFQQFYQQHLPECRFPNASAVIWDKPMS